MDGRRAVLVRNPVLSIGRTGEESSVSSSALAQGVTNMRKIVLLSMAVGCLALAGCATRHYQSEILLAGDYKTEQVEEAMAKVSKDVGLGDIEKTCWIRGRRRECRAFHRYMLKRPKKYDRAFFGSRLGVVYYRAQKRIVFYGPPSALHIGVRKDLVIELLKPDNVKVYEIEYWVPEPLFPWH
jgi:hypothetical protein